jgi:hypothetical protein
MSNNLSDSYILGNNIDCYSATREGGELWNNGAGFEPVGDNTINFTGNLNGNNYTINGLHINRPADSSIGLFGRINDATIIKVNLIDVNITGDTSVGGITGHQLNSTLNRNSVTGKIFGRGYVGGIVGWLRYGWLGETYSDVNVYGESFVGGLVGHQTNGSLIVDSYSLGPVTGNIYVGGAAGYQNDATISHSYSTGFVTGNMEVGGLVGADSSGNGIVTNSYYNLETSGQSDVGDGEGKTISEMKQESTFTEWGFYNGIWEIDEDESYPYLINNEQIPHPTD